MSRRIRMILISLASLMIFPTCGKKTDLSEGITVSVEPQASYILPGDAASCKDVKAYFDSPDGGLQQSVSELRVNFPSFKLKWAKDDQLTIAIIKLSLRHPSIEGGLYECKVSGDDLYALMGAIGGKLNGKNDPVLGTDDNTLDSGETNREAINGFPACGLDCGGIKLKDKAGNFKARGTLEVVGYSYNPTTKEQKPVKVTINPSVEYFK